MYDWLNTTNLFGVFVYMNTVTNGLFWTFMGVLAPFIVMIIMSSGKLKARLPIISFVIMMLSIFFSIIGLVGINIVFVFVVIWIGSLVWSFREGSQ